MKNKVILCTFGLLAFLIKAEASNLSISKLVKHASYFSSVNVQLFNKIIVEKSQFNDLTTNEEGIEVYPNPLAQGYLSIVIPINTEYSVSILNVLGKRIMETKSHGSKILKIAHADFPFPGMYFIQILDSVQTQTKRIIVK